MGGLSTFSPAQGFLVGETAIAGPGLGKEKPYVVGGAAGGIALRAGGITCICGVFRDLGIGGNRARSGGSGKGVCRSLGVHGGVISTGQGCGGSCSGGSCWNFCTWKKKKISIAGNVKVIYFTIFQA